LPGDDDPRFGAFSPIEPPLNELRVTDYAIRLRLGYGERFRNASVPGENGGWEV
jgi:hypothetical protein